MIRGEIEELLLRHPFERFVIHATSGERFEVRTPALAVLLKSAIVIAFPNSDRRVIVPFLHVASVEVVNGRRPTAWGRLGQSTLPVIGRRTAAANPLCGRRRPASRRRKS